MCTTSSVSDTTRCAIAGLITSGTRGLDSVIACDKRKFGDVIFIQEKVD
jgi:hypothetical protein